MGSILNIRPVAPVSVQDITSTVNQFREGQKRNAIERQRQQTLLEQQSQLQINQEFADKTDRLVSRVETDTGRDSRNALANLRALDPERAAKVERRQVDLMASRAKGASAEAAASRSRFEEASRKTAIADRAVSLLEANPDNAAVKARVLNFLSDDTVAEAKQRGLAGEEEIQFYRQQVELDKEIMNDPEKFEGETQLGKRFEDADTAEGLGQPERADRLRASAKRLEAGEELDLKVKQAQVRKLGAESIESEDRTIALRGTTQNSVQKEIIRNLELVEQLTELDEQLDGVGDLLTVSGRLKNILLIGADYLSQLEEGGAGAKFLTRRQNLETDTAGVFVVFRAAITGAAASPKELEQLERQFISTAKSPTLFAASARRLLKNARRAVRFRFDLMSQGFVPGSPEYAEKIRSQLGPNFGSEHTGPDLSKSKGAVRNSLRASYSAAIRKTGSADDAARIALEEMVALGFVDSKQEILDMFTEDEIAAIIGLETEQ